jgi:hypothetical protein
MVAETLEEEFSQYSKAELELVRLLHRELAGVDLAKAGPLPDLVHRMTSAVEITWSPWQEVIGPVYTTKGVCKLLGITRQAVHQLVQKRALLRLVTDDKVSVYPAFQFAEGGRRLPGLKQVLDALAKGIDDEWTWAQWLNSAAEDAPSAVELMWAGRIDEVLAEAVSDALRWSH